MLPTDNMPALERAIAKTVDIYDHAVKHKDMTLRLKAMALLAMLRVAVKEAA